MKPSSRAGRFKKKLVSEEQLLREAPLVEASMTPFHELHNRQKVTDCELTAVFLIQVLAIRFPGTWLGAKRPSLGLSHELNLPMDTLTFEPNIQRRLTGLSLGDVLNGFALKSTPEAVNRALLHWSSGTYPLELMFRIPGPLEVLEQQYQGRRCVTVLTEASRTSRFILNERDTLSFTMHDLIHADHFYHDNACYQGQLALYGFLRARREDFRELLAIPEFAAEFEYLIADMNAYAIHSLKCLKAAIIHYGSKELFADWVREFEIRDELLRLNTREYDPHESDHKILHWLEKFAATAP